MSNKNSFITQAFKQFGEMLDEELEVDGVKEVPVYEADTDNMHDFLDTAGEDEPVDVIDLEAETVEDLKQSYVGKVVLDCNVCHSNIFLDKDEVVVDENGVANVDMECPYCISNEGYTVIGKITPFEEDEPEEVEEEEIEIEEVPEEGIEEGLNEDVYDGKGPIVYTNSSKIIKLDKEEAWEDSIADGYFEAIDMYGPWVPKEEFITKIIGEDKSPMTYEELLDYLESDEDNIFILRLDRSKKEGLISKKEHAKGYSDVYADVAKGITTDAEADAVTDELDKQLKEGCSESKKNLDECGDTETVQEELELDGEPKLRGVGKLRHRDDKEGSEKIRGKNNTNLSGTDDLHESIQDVQITTDDETMTMTTKEDGGIAVETTPNESFEESDMDFEEPVEEETFEDTADLEAGDEMIAPIDDEEEEEVELNSEVDALSDEEIDELESPDEIDIDEFDEDSFDELGESYLTRHYDNVEGFKTVNAKVYNNSLIIEGVIRFNSGNSKCTSFVFEASKFNPKKKSALFEGYNSQISRGKKTYKMNCLMESGKIKPVKLSYNYRAKNELNESIRVNGTAKVKR